VQEMEAALLARLRQSEGEGEGAGGGTTAVVAAVWVGRSAWRGESCASVWWEGRERGG